MRIKQAFGDFIVNEAFRLPVSNGGSNRYSYFFLRKSGMTTHEAVRNLAYMLRVQKKDVGYAGLKDKNAITSQLVSVKDVGRERICGMVFPGYSLEFAGSGDTPVTIGCLEGNNFKLVVRDIESIDVLAERFSRFEGSGFSFPNYFGGQRFGSANWVIGKAIVKKDFNDAASLIQPEFKGDAIKFLRTDRKLSQFFIHSYQAFLFNDFVSTSLSNLPSRKVDYAAGFYVFPESVVDKNATYPLVGFATEIGQYENEASAIVNGVMEREGIKFRDFIIRSIPEISCEGGERRAFDSADNFKFAFADDELNPGKSMCTLDFFLKKGCYATVLIDFLFR